MTPHPEQLDPRAFDSERGSALVLVLIMILMLSGIVITLSVAVSAQSRNSLEGGVHELRMENADNGLAKGLAIARRTATTVDYGVVTDIVGTAVAPENGAHVTCERISGVGTTLPLTLRLTSRGSQVSVGGGATANYSRVLEMIVTIRAITPPGPPLRGPGGGAVEGLGDFTTRGGIVIDGRDHNLDGSLGGGHDTVGFNISGTLDQGGSSTVGGGDGTTTYAPGASPPENVAIDNNSTRWEAESTVGIDTTTDGYDNDNDGFIDAADLDGEAPQASWDGDGYDNDNDNLSDENGFPNNAGELFGQPDNSAFKASAIANGTYFRVNGSQVERHDGTNFISPVQTFNDWVTTADALDGGDIVYAEGTDGEQFGGKVDLPDTQTSGGDPSLYMFQNIKFTDGSTPTATDHNTTIKLHPPAAGAFIGVLVADIFDKVNSSGVIIGGVISYNAFASSQDKFGNGGAEILFSSAAMFGLPNPNPGPSTPTPPEVMMWREIK